MTDRPPTPPGPDDAAQPSPPPAVPVSYPAVLATGVAWSLGSLAARFGEVQATGAPLWFAALAVMAGGVITVAAVWIGTGAVLWAMARLVGTGRPIQTVVAVVSRQLWPLALGAPAWALVTQAGMTGLVGGALIAVSAVSVLWFGLWLFRDMVATLRVPASAAALALGLAVIFIASLFILQSPRPGPE